MGKKLRAAKTKTRLREITLKLSENGTSSLEVVRAFKKRYPDMDSAEREDLIDIGLMVLAGRVAVSGSASTEGDADLFSNHGYPDFVSVRTKNGNKFSLVRRMGRTLTAREYFANSSEPDEKPLGPAKPSKQQQFHTRMLEMRDKGLLDTTLPDYLKQVGG